MGFGKMKKYFINMGDYGQVPTKLNVWSSNIFSIKNRYDMVFARGSNSDSTTTYRFCVFRKVTGLECKVGSQEIFGVIDKYGLRV